MVTNGTILSCRMSTSISVFVIGSICHRGTDAQQLRPQFWELSCQNPEAAHFGMVVPDATPAQTTKCLQASKSGAVAKSNNIYHIHEMNLHNNLVYDHSLIDS